MEKRYYCNFKRYDATGKRIAIFGVPLEGENKGKLKINVIRCSRKDQFSKKFARKEYEDYDTTGTCKDCHPETSVVPMEDVKRPKWSFLTWVNKHFFTRIVDRIEYEQGVEIKWNKTEKYIEFYSLGGGIASE